MIGIVITAYNRALPLQCLLDSLNKINSCGLEIPLIISIDNNGTPEVNKVAEQFNWKYGKKEIVIHKERLGLVKHFIWAGDQTSRFENVIFLEDDLLVSPELINFSSQLIEFYKDDEEVAAASLYNPVLNEETGTKFYQIEDDYDVYFLQHPYWGNIWFRNKWMMFKEYLATYQKNPVILPNNVAAWGDKSFKQKYIQYLIETNRTVVTARVSVVTNNGYSGLHNDDGLYMYQSVLKLKGDKYRFPHVSESIACYDAYEEISPEILKKLNEKLCQFDFEMDINGTKTEYKKAYVITSRTCKTPIMKFSSLMKPTETSIVVDALGDGGISLCKREDVVFDSLFLKERLIRDINKNYRLLYGFSFLKFVFKSTINFYKKRMK